MREERLVFSSKLSCVHVQGRGQHGASNETLLSFDTGVARPVTDAQKVLKIGGVD